MRRIGNTKQNKAAQTPRRLLKAAVLNKRAYRDQLIFVLDMAFASLSRK